MKGICRFHSKCFIVAGCWYDTRFPQPCSCSLILAPSVNPCVCAASIYRVLKQLRSEGYDVGSIPANEDDLIK